MRILLVEDDPLIGLSASETLQQAGETVIGPFVSASSAVAGAENMAIDVALLDINLEGPEDGVWLARELRRRFGVHSVFMSGEVTMAHSNKDAALGHLCKPYSDRQLSESLPVIRALLSGLMAPPPVLPAGFAVFRTV